jgi:hypothetical protein
MRALCFLFLLVFIGAVAFLAYQNQQEATLVIWDRVVVTSIPVLVGLTYLAGMLSGWTVVGMLRRSLNRVISQPLPGEYSPTR